MKKMFIIILIIELINIIFSIVPIWKLENSAVDLLHNSKEYSYNICDRFMYKLSLYKKHSLKMMIKSLKKIHYI